MEAFVFTWLKLRGKHDTNKTGGLAHLQISIFSQEGIFQKAFSKIKKYIMESIKTFKSFLIDLYPFKQYLLTHCFGK